MEHDITQLIGELASGNEHALERLIELALPELHRIAARYLRWEDPGHTLQATALVNEAYLRLAGQRNKTWRDRTHFYGVAAHLMRLILVDHARKHQAEKRGGLLRRVDLDNLDQIRVFDKAQFDDLIALDDALARLELIDPRAMQVVECRFFAGLNVKETAEFLRVSQKTVKNDWQYAKAWLSAELKSQP